MNEVAIKVIESKDGRHRAEIIWRGDGHYSFASESLRELEEGVELWLPDGGSGIYEDAESAEREARAIIPWLRDELG